MAATEVEDLEPGPWVDELVRIWQRDGELDPDTVAREGARKSSPLYQFFTHSPGDALRKLNRIEAGRLIRRAEVIIEVEGGEVHKYRAFLHTDTKQYQPTGIAMSRKDLREQVLGRMQSDIQIMIGRYEKYASIAEVDGAIKLLRRWLKAHGE